MTIYLLFNRLIKNCIGLIFLLVSMGATSEITTSEFNIDEKILKSKISIAVESQQMIVVSNEARASSNVTIYTFEKIDGAWVRVFSPFQAVIGKQGFADIGNKKEGDLKTPSGSFLIRTAFGHPPRLDTKLYYRQSNKDDYWIDDINSTYYNTLSKGKNNAKSYEKMLRKDDLYKYGLVIEYNTNPIVKGLGSAIFMHIWRGVGSPTVGCVAMPEKYLLNLLKWLDVAMAPSIVMGTKDTLRDILSFNISQSESIGN